MCLLKQKILKAQEIALKKLLDAQEHQEPQMAEEQQEVVLPDNKRSESTITNIPSPLEETLSLPKVAPFKIKEESYEPSEGFSSSTEHESQDGKKKGGKKSAKSVKSSKAVSTGASHNISPTKNIAINFGKAMASFALSHIAIPYILQYVEEANLTLQDFIVFVKKAKKQIKSMQGLRSLLLVEAKDDKATAGYKLVFQKICELFVKNYSVNWITHSKLAYKLVYLKWRFKMLRRIRNPELFTHIC